MAKGKRGRPLGFKLSESSKRAISQSKIGQKHSQETKDKISQSLILYFKRKHPLSDEIEKHYCDDEDDYTYKWVDMVREDIDNLEDVLTDRTLRNKQKMEITCGEYIEFFHHEITPELIILFKEHCNINNLDLYDELDKL